MSGLYPDDDETKKLAHTIRLNGKTIYEWREDSRIYLDDKLHAEKKSIQDANECGTRIDELEIERADLNAVNAQLTADNAQLTAINAQLTAANKKPPAR